MTDLALVPLLLASALGLFMGARYFRRQAFMPYQQAVVGRDWTQLEPGIRAVVLAMLKVVGGGFGSFGIALLWLCLALHQGVRWAPWAILTSSAALLGPALVATLSLRAFRPEADPPVRPTIAAIALILVGVALALAG